MCATSHKHHQYVTKQGSKKHNESVVFLHVCFSWGGHCTLGVEGDEAVTKRPLVHGLVEDYVLWEDDHSDVLEPAKPLQDLGHRLGL